MGLLHNLRMGTVIRKTKWWNFQLHPMIYRKRSQAGWGRVAVGGWLEIKLHKNALTMRLMSFLVDGTCQSAGRVMFPDRTQKHHTLSPQKLALCVSSIQLFLSCMLCNRLINISK